MSRWRMLRPGCLSHSLIKSDKVWHSLGPSFQTWYTLWSVTTSCHGNPLDLLPSLLGVCRSNHMSPGLFQHSCLQTLLIKSSERELEWYVLYLSPSPTLILPNYRVFSFISLLGILIVGELSTVSFPSTYPVFLLTRLGWVQNFKFRAIWWNWDCNILASHASLQHPTLVLSF